MGRFTCPDPLGDTGGDHDVYEYCVDDPVNMSDPSGLFGEGLSGFMRQQGLKERATRPIDADVPKDDNQTPQGMRKIGAELGRFDVLGTCEFDQKVQKAEVKRYGGGTGKRGIMKRIYGDVDDEVFAKLGISMPTKADMEKMRHHPEHKLEMEQYLSKDPTPLRVDMTRDQYNREEHLRKLQRESPVTKEQMWVNEVADLPNNIWEDMKDPRTLVGKVVGKAAEVAVSGGPLLKFGTGFLIDKVTVESMKKIDEIGEKKRKKRNKK